MKKNIIFYFSGTGNSLKASMEIAKSLPNCKLVSMGKNDSYELNEIYDSIGFIYPSYFQGLPSKVNSFISNLNLKDNYNSYTYAITTFGSISINSISQLNKLLSLKGLKLNYGEKLKMPGNYIVLYERSKDSDEVLSESYKRLSYIANNIKNKYTVPQKKSTFIVKIYYILQIKKVSNDDNHFNVSNNCTGCGLCKKVCPVGNISFENKKPNFNHKCEQCMACLQYCPSSAINYKNKTQNRKRYVNPDISYNELIDNNI